MKTLLAAMLAVASIASANEISFFWSAQTRAAIYEGTHLSFEHSFDVPLFDSSLGTLDAVDVSLTARGTGLAQYLYIGNPDYANPSRTGSYTFSGTSSFLDESAQATSSGTFPYVAYYVPGSRFGASVTIPLAFSRTGDLSEFIGDGFIPVTALMNLGISATGPGLMCCEWWGANHVTTSDWGSWELNWSYDYTPAIQQTQTISNPEPKSIWLLLALVLIARPIFVRLRCISECSTHPNRSS